MEILTTEDKDFIRNNLKDYTSKGFAEYFNNLHKTDIYKRQIISEWIYSNNLLPRQKRKTLFSDYDVDFIKNNYNTMSYKEIAEKLHYTEKQIRSKAEHLGLTKNRRFNNRYFEKIDTPLKAYFLGFIFADGYITHTPSGSYEFGMELQSGDRYIIDKLNNELGGLHEIKTNAPEDRIVCGNLIHKTESCVLRVYSKPLVNDLIANNIVFNKTLSDKFPKVDDEFFFDYLRGYFDGDGCIYNNRGRLRIQIVCAVKSTLDYLKEKLNQCGIHTEVYKETDRKYVLVCANVKDVKMLINKMYYSSDVFCLSRKKDKAEPLINIGSVA